jgi:hypothetical protein
MRAGLAAAGLLAAGCMLPDMAVSPAEDRIVAEVFLRVGDPRQRALLHGTIQTEVRGAAIVVTDPEGRSLAYRESDEGCVGAGIPPLGVCYEAEAAADFVRPGVTYRLHIDAGGRILTGVTTVPADFALVEPVFIDGATPVECSLPSWGSFDLVWTQSVGTWVYLLETRIWGIAGAVPEAPPDLEEPLRLLGVSISSSDTTMRFPSNLGVFQRFEVDPAVLLALQRGLPGGISGDVVLAAGDRNLVNWLRGGNFNPSGPVRVPSIRGAGTGAFGSLVPKPFSFVVRQSAADPEVRCTHVIEQE